MQPYRKQAARQTKPSSAGDTSPGALVARVLGRPELYPDEFKAWLPRWLAQNVNLVLSAQNLPLVETRKLVGGTGNAAFSNSWVNFGGSNESAQYYKDYLGRVFLGGVVKDGTVNPGSTGTIFTLPVGYRPEQAKIYAVPSNGAFGLCTVNPDGSVVASVGNNTYFSLSGISFRAYS